MDIEDQAEREVNGRCRVRGRIVGWWVVGAGLTGGMWMTEGGDEAGASG